MVVLGMKGPKEMVMRVFLLAIILLFGWGGSTFAAPQTCGFLKEKVEIALNDFDVGVYQAEDPNVRVIGSNKSGEPSDNDLVVGVVDCDATTGQVQQITICTRMHYTSSAKAAMLTVLVASLSTGVSLEKLNVALAEMVDVGSSQTRRDGDFVYFVMNYPAGSIGKNQQVCLTINAVEIDEDSLPQKPSECSKFELELIEFYRPFNTALAPDAYHIRKDIGPSNDPASNNGHSFGQLVCDDEGSVSTYQHCSRLAFPSAADEIEGVMAIVATFVGVNVSEVQDLVGEAYDQYLEHSVLNVSESGFSRRDYKRYELLVDANPVSAFQKFHEVCLTMALLPTD